MADVNNARRPHTFFTALAVIGALALLTVGCVLGLVGYAISKAPGMTLTSMSGGDSHDASRYLRGLGMGEKAFAGIRLEGEINSPVADVVLEKLKAAMDDERIQGVLLEVESPGGAVVPSQEMYDALKRTKERKPVVAYVRDVAASGAYYAIASASAIVANRGSMVGSIGVILSSVEITELLSWAKLKPVTLKTGKLKDAGSPMREWTEDDKAYLQGLIDKTREQFASDVKAARGLGDVAMERMSDGRVVLGPEAAELRLIDKVGDRELALATLTEIAKLEKAPEVFELEESRPELPLFIHYLFGESAHAFGASVGTSLGVSMREGVRTGLREGLTDSQTRQPIRR
ncbi:MAG: signal peptide peptidase SppA [Silvanigrellales bacterium]|nr:signal peptide peptidase SppA [Silvanigrellales bacterium]